MCVNGCTADNYRDFLMCQNHLWATAKGEYTALLKPESKIPLQKTPISDGFGATAVVPDEENPMFGHFRPLPRNYRSIWRVLHIDGFEERMIQFFFI